MDSELPSCIMHIIEGETEPSPYNVPQGPTAFWVLVSSQADQGNTWNLI